MIIRSTVALLCSAALLAGCAFRPQVTGMAMEYNEFVSKATNQQTAINILRARFREPLHFTSFTKVIGTSKLEASAGLQSVVAGVAEERTPSGSALATSKKTFGATSWTPSAGIKINSGTDFEIGISANDDFWKGIMAPVAPSTLVYFLKQGWPADLLSHLFIHRIDYFAEIENPDGTKQRVPLGSVINSPSMRNSAVAFDDAIRCRKLAYRLDEPLAKAPLPVREIGDLAGVAPELLGRLKANGAVGNYDLASGGKAEFVLALSKRGDDFACRLRQKKHFEALAENGKADGITVNLPAVAALFGSEYKANDVELKSTRLAREPEVQSTGRVQPEGDGASISFANEDYFTPFLNGGWKGNLIVEMNFRSVEAVIYYLGEYSRPHAYQAMLRGGCKKPEDSKADDDTKDDDADDKDAGLPKSFDAPDEPSAFEVVRKAYREAGKTRYCTPILVMRELAEGEPDDSFITTEFKGKRYAIPSSGEKLGGDAGRSSQVITIVQQMLNLHRSSKDLPSTPTVRVLN